MTERLELDFIRYNYSSLVLAGLGAVGQGFLKLGQRYLNQFEDVLLIDRDFSLCEKIGTQYLYQVERLDIEDYEILCVHLSSLAPPVLLINACVGIDTVQLRKTIQHLDVGYIDICESRHPDGAQTGFTVGMPYTNQPFHGRFPHLICQGCNPGMVEYIARMLIHQMDSEQDGYSVTIFENDQLATAEKSDDILVSWSPQDLIEEVMIAPSIEYVNNHCIQGSIPTNEVVMTQWQKKLCPAFNVGHEDIWNLGLLEQVSDVRFFYGFNNDVMKIFRGDLTDIVDMLRLPNENEAIKGLERIVVSVKHPNSGLQKNLLWQADHAQIQQKYGINAVQYQTGLSLLMSMLLMQHTDIGCRKGTYNASTLSLTNYDWDIFRELMDRLEINWRPMANDYVRCINDHPDISVLTAANKTS